MDSGGRLTTLGREVLGADVRLDVSQALGLTSAKRWGGECTKARPWAALLWVSVIAACGCAGPPVSSRGDRVRPPNERLARVQVEALVVLTPRAGNALLFLEEHMLDPLP